MNDTNPSHAKLIAEIVDLRAERQELIEALKALKHWEELALIIAMAEGREVSGVPIPKAEAKAVSA